MRRWHKMSSKMLRRITFPPMRCQQMRSWEKQKLYFFQELHFLIAPFSFSFCIILVVQQPSLDKPGLSNVGDGLDPQQNTLQLLQTYKGSKICFCCFELELQKSNCIVRRMQKYLRNAYS